MSEIKASFFTTRLSQFAALVLLLVLGFGIRLYDLTDLPLDFHPTRQLLSALKARGMYYETLTDVPSERRSFAIQQWKFRAAIEPEVVERLTALTYQFTGEQLWVARIYSSLFWVIGAIFLFLLGRRLTSADGALAAAAFYLFAPYAVTASRSFQPDPLMTALIVVFWWVVYEWSENPTSYKWAIAAGLVGGFAIYVKFVAAFFVVSGGLGAALRRDSLRAVFRRPQAYVMALLGILPGAGYVVYGVWVAGFLGQQFGGRFIPAYFLSPSYYFGWMGTLNLAIGAAALTMSLLGLFFFAPESRRFALALWAGYFLFGLYFNYHISTHDYYSLPLIPIAALSLAPLAAWFFSQLTQRTAPRLARFAAYAVLLFGLFAALWTLRAEMKRVDYRPEAAMWAEISEVIGDRNAAGLVQDYGARLSYWGWKNLTPWQTYGDAVYHADLRGARNDFEEIFADLAERKELFVATDFDELKRQPFLRGKLDGYPLFAEGDGYVIYNLVLDK